MHRDKSLEERKQLAINLVEFGSYLNDLRKERNLTLQQLAEKLGVSANWISELERGKGKSPSDLLVRKIAAFFDVQEDELFDKVGRIPLKIREIIENEPKIKETLSYIASMDVNQELKDELIDEVLNTVHEFYKRHGG